MSANQPNILMIMADQLMPFLTGAYGHPVVKTPHLDRLVGEGVRFDAAYTSCPLCAPARASLMTGKHVSNIKAYDNAAALDSEEPTLAHYLAVAGYDTVVSGKMHYVGPDQLHGLHRRLTTDIYPEEYDWLSLRNSEDPPSYDFAEAYTSEGVRIGEWSPHLGYDEETHFRANAYLRAQGVAQKAAREKGQPRQPFFLMASYHHPHDPFWPPKTWWDLYENEPIDIPEFPDNLEETYSAMDRWHIHHHGCRRFPLLKDPDSLRCLRRAYYALVSYIDHKVGELLTTLEESGLMENTVVMFLSDHGDMLGEKGMVQKRSFYEWSCRIPFILRFPDQQFAGRVVGEPTSLIDVLPTVCEIAGVRDYLPVDGKSVMELIDSGNGAPRQVFSEYHSNGVYTTCFMIRSGRFKYIHIHEEQDQLFDLENDPHEMHNLIGEPQVAAIEQDLKNRILETFDPQRIEEDVRATIRKRRLFKQWGEVTGVKWDCHPDFDANKNAVTQYLPHKNKSTSNEKEPEIWQLRK
jgi:choline-sulfatase